MSTLSCFPLHALEPLPQHRFCSYRFSQCFNTYHNREAHRHFPSLPCICNAPFSHQSNHNDRVITRIHIQYREKILGHFSRAQKHPHRCFELIKISFHTFCLALSLCNAWAKPHNWTQVVWQSEIKLSKPERLWGSVSQGSSPAWCKQGTSEVKSDQIMTVSSFTAVRLLVFFFLVS